MVSDDQENRKTFEEKVEEVIDEKERWRGIYFILEEV